MIGDRQNMVNCCFSQSCRLLQNHHPSVSLQNPVKFGLQKFFMLQKTLKLSSTVMQHMPHSKAIFLVWTVIVIGTIITTVALDDLRLLVIPFVAFGIYLSVTDFRTVFLLMWAAIPFSTEVDLPGGFSTDFPDELFMILLTGITLLWCAYRLKTLSLVMLLHPITVILMIHVGWIAFTALLSSTPFLSFKFLLAKIWYVVPFYVLSYHLLRNEQNIRRWFYWVLISLLVTVAVIVFRHSLERFSFDSINTVLAPFYRNHVDYALILGVFFPFVFVLRHHWMSKWIGWILCGIFVMAIYLTYTRAAYVGLVVAAVGFLLVRLKLVRYTILAALVISGIFLINLSKDNRYIDYAPNYYKTISHEKFDNLLEATYKFEDVSTMERFYRWIAAFYMVQEKPLTGFGPNNFVSFYKTYSDRHFVTYVSDNPEQSGVHNYFLMTAVEQGIPGLIIFLALLFITLLRAEWLYHRLIPGFYRKLLVGVIGSLFFILFALLLNDMIETDKVGSFFFLNLALIVIIERNARHEQAFKIEIALKADL